MKLNKRKKFCFILRKDVKNIEKSYIILTTYKIDSLRASWLAKRVQYSMKKNKSMQIIKFSLEKVKLKLVYY